ncbi:MAG: YbgC/FadM family acyl-CoA thioesterase [Alphaproteobacteria bacterium]|nr:MAG: YbgC/FadM family acyl-CoA thioesterase [Alphaproteobacteria bacterium]
MRIPAPGQRPAGAEAAGEGDCLQAHFRDRTFRLPLRVYYEDTDAAGIVHHARYLAFLERARSEMLWALGLDDWGEPGEGGQVVRFAIAKAEMAFRRPARLFDRLWVETQIRHIGAASMDAAQVVLRGDQPLVYARIKAASVDEAGRPRRLPAHWRRVLAPLVVPATAGDALDLSAL